MNIMSDAIEAACREFLLHKGETPWRVGRRGVELWGDYVPAMTAAITAYEAAKGGGVGEDGSSAADYIRGLLGLCQMIAGRDDCPPAIREVLAHNHRYADALKFAAYRIRSALTSPASGERDAATASDESGE